MNRSICAYLPAPKVADNINFINFVYETEFHKIKQPVFRSTYLMHIVTEGTAEYTFQYNTYSLKKGSIFFIFPGFAYDIKASQDFEFMYVNFIGIRAAHLLERLHISGKNPVLDGYAHLLDFWSDAFVLMNELNMDIITESVFYYTLSHIAHQIDIDTPSSSRTEGFSAIKNYIDVHYTDSDMSLDKIAKEFSYNPRYFCSLFKKNTGVSFVKYLRDMRMRRACELFRSGITSVFEVSLLCGYNDALYFSKQFKASKGMNPTKYIKSI